MGIIPYEIGWGGVEQILLVTLDKSKTSPNGPNKMAKLLGSFTIPEGISPHPSAFHAAPSQVGGSFPIVLYNVIHSVAT